MKILYLTPTDRFSGGENVTLQIAKQMHRRGHIVAYCSPVGDIENSVAQAEVPFIALPSFSLKNVRTAIRDFSPDVVHAMDYRASFYASLVFSRTVGHLHSNCPWLKKICPNSIALYITARRAKKLLCVSQSIPDDFIFVNGVKHKFEVLANVSDAEHILEKSRAFRCGKTFDMGYCGRLSEPKNPLAFVEIVNEIRKTIPQVRAIMIGDGELRKQVEDSLQQLQLESNVELVGFQTNPFPYIDACKVMVMPSLWEGFPMAAIEALALGKPLVSTPVSGLRDIITDQCGGLGKTTEEMTQKVLHCLRCSKDDYKKMQENAKTTAGRYTDMPGFINRIESLYNSLL